MTDRTGPRLLLRTRRLVRSLFPDCRRVYAQEEGRGCLGAAVRSFPLQPTGSYMRAASSWLKSLMLSR
jgi:hypothetical protein